MGSECAGIMVFRSHCVNTYRLIVKNTRYNVNGMVGITYSYDKKWRFKQKGREEDADNR